MPLPESGGEEPAAPGMQAGRRQSGGPILPSSTRGNQALTSQAWSGQYVQEESHHPHTRTQGPDPAALRDDAWSLLCATGGITVV